MINYREAERLQKELLKRKKTKRARRRLMRSILKKSVVSGPFERAVKLLESQIRAAIQIKMKLIAASKMPSMARQILTPVPADALEIAHEETKNG